MYRVELQWKEFNVDVHAIVSKMQTDHGENYKGQQCGGVLELWFEEQLTEQEIEAIQTWWDGLTNQSTEATGYRSQIQIEEALATIKTGLLNKTWDQMSEIERKMVLNMTVTKDELITAELL